MALQHSSLAVCEFCTASEECCRQGYDQCVQTLLPDVVAPETQQNSLCELKLNFRVTTPEFLHGGRLHWGPHKPQNCQNLRVDPCLGMGTCTGQYSMLFECGHLPPLHPLRVHLTSSRDKAFPIDCSSISIMQTKEEKNRGRPGNKATTYNYMYVYELT